MIPKFKVFHREDKKMYDVFQIVEYTNGIHKVGIKGTCWEFLIDGKYQEGDLVQWIGVLDKKGKEIFEGDIVERTCPDIDDEYYKERSVFGSIFGVIHWNDKNCSFYIEQISNGSFKFDKNDTYGDDNNLIFYDYDGKEFDWNDLEVVGNIYENKEFYEKELEKYKLGNKEE